jgi:hypothetical protein
MDRIAPASPSRVLRLVLALCFAPAAPTPADAQSASDAATPPQQTDGASLPFDINVHGFLLGVGAGRMTGERPPGGDAFALGEERVRFDVTAEPHSGQPRVVIKGDLLHDAIANRLDDDLREAYLTDSLGPVDMSLGRHVVTWGVGDLFFINDVFPKDWASFFSGLPMEYLKLGVDGMRMMYSSQEVNADFLAIPLVTTDNFPSPTRFLMFNPFSGLPNQRVSKPETRLSDVELALRLYRNLMGSDVSLYLYDGFWKEPSVRLDNLVSPTTATRFYPRLRVYGASMQRNLFDGVVSVETGYYDSAEQNSAWRLLAGYQREVWQDFTAELQFFGEFRDHSGPSRGSLVVAYPPTDQFISTRLTQLLDYQTWTLSLFAAYSPIHQDYFLQPYASYHVTDRLSVYLGASIFGGPRPTFFGQFDGSDLAFLGVRIGY